MNKTGTKLHTRKYPWKDWFNRREPFVLQQGVDFNGRAYTMAQQIRNNAGIRRYGMEVKVTVNEDENTVTVLVLGKRRK